MSLLFSVLTALALTLVFELLFALVWGVRQRGLLLVILMNILTNPAVNVLYYGAYLLGWQSAWLVLLLELAAAATEGFCCKGMIRRPWLFAVLVNAFSYGMGELIQFFI